MKRSAPSFPPPIVRRVLASIAAASLLAAGAPPAGAARPTYPPARKAAVVDDYFGTKVADPYRWLENADDAETMKWVDAQNALTRSSLDSRRREAIHKRLTELFDYPRVGAPVGESGRYFYGRNSGLQNQPVIHVREGLDGSERVLLDPNALSEDGTVALTARAPSRDGRLFGYAISRSGSDRQELYVRDVATGEDLPDKVLWAKFTGLTWAPDASGFYYTRFPQPGTVPVGDENYFAKVYFHRLGDAQEKDTLVFETPDRKEVIWAPAVTFDGRWVVLTGFQGATDKTEVWLIDRSHAGARPERLFAGFAHAWLFAGDVDNRLLFVTDQDAPLRRVVAVDLNSAERTPVEVIAQGADKVENVTVVNRQIVVNRMRNASHRISIHGLEGRETSAIALPALGTVPVITGDPGDAEMFLVFTSFAYPTTPYRYDFATGRLSEFAKPEARIDGADYEVKQVTYPSRDGTKVTMFLVHGQGLPLDGRRPTLLHGYGGFNVSLTPFFDPFVIAWLERGGVYALANLRGGGEYGEAWHEAGMLERKQNVFDDFIAAAEWLTGNGYTRREKLAIQGGSNGGLLVGAVMTQRPDLFGAVVCKVPVADMLRYHLFTVGRYWIPEYGSSEDPKQFGFLYRYSPYHNVKDGAAYPATLITTAETDDRVAPGLARKFAARLQAATSGRAPILIRVETKAGHGGGKPLSKQIDEQADVYAFLFDMLGVPGPDTPAQ